VGRGVEAHLRERGRSRVVRRSVAAVAGEAADGGHGRHARVLEIVDLTDVGIGVVVFEGVAVAAEEREEMESDASRSASIDSPSSKSVPGKDLETH